MKRLAFCAGARVCVAGGESGCADRGGGSAVGAVAGAALKNALVAGAADGGALWKSSKSSSPPTCRDWTPGGGSAFSVGAETVFPKASSSMPKRSTTGCAFGGSKGAAGSVEERCGVGAWADEVPATEFERRGTISSSPASRCYSTRIECAYYNIAIAGFFLPFFLSRPDKTLYIYKRRDVCKLSYVPTFTYLHTRTRMYAVYIYSESVMRKKCKNA